MQLVILFNLVCRSIVDMSEVKLPGKVQQNNLPPECGQPINEGAYMLINICYMYIVIFFLKQKPIICTPLTKPPIP
jgi:hypothetical protein